MSDGAMHDILIPWLGAIALTGATLLAATVAAWRQGRTAKAREARGEFPVAGPLWPFKE